MSATPRTPVPQHLGDPVPMTLPRLAEKKRLGEPVVMVTAYDFPSARAAEAAGVDLVLVGDSGAMTVLGYDSTVPVTLDELLVLARAVRRGLRTPFMVGDLPFGSYEVSDEQAVQTAFRFYKAQGRSAHGAMKVATEALALQDAGCFSMVFEAIPSALSAELMPHVHIPVIGIGAGPATDGQVLVFHDLLGIREGLGARFVKRYANLQEEMDAGVAAYAADVRSRAYPGPEHGYSIDEAELG